ncbi:MAG: hypothetical protein RLZZ490_1290 [Cyanobacteriota bacterium]|jgi:hypothetical protein
MNCKINLPLATTQIVPLVSGDDTNPSHVVISRVTARNKSTVEPLLDLTASLICTVLMGGLPDRGKLRLDQLQSI